MEIQHTNIHAAEGPTGQLPDDHVDAGGAAPSPDAAPKPRADGKVPDPESPGAFITPEELERRRALAVEEEPPKPDEEVDPNAPQAKAHELVIEGPISEEFKGDAERFAGEVGQLAASTGISQVEAQSAFTFGLDLALTDVPGIDGGNPDETRGYLASRYGEDGAKRLIADAQAALRRLGPEWQDYLEAADEQGRRKGNHPSVLTALAELHRGTFKLAPAAAEKELTRLRGTKEYARGDRATADRVRALSTIAYRTKSEPEPAEPAPLPPSQAQKLEAELVTLRTDPAYFDKRRPNHKAVLARVQQIYVLLHGSD